MSNATSGTALECSICLDEYDNTSRRPRVLPCAHNCCSKCLQNCIAQGSKKCSVCRKKYTAATVEEFPINTDLENLIEMFKLMAVKVDKTAVNTDKTAEEYMKIKENRLNQTQLDIEHFETVTTSLKSVLEEKKENIASKKANIDLLQKEVDEECKVCDNIEKELSENMSITQRLQGGMQMLKIATTNTKIDNECSHLQIDITSMKQQLQKIEKKFEFGKFLNVLMEDPKHAIKLIKTRQITAFAVDGEHIIRSSKIKPSGNNLLLSSLQKEVKPTPNATLIPVWTLLSGLGAEPIVYLDLKVGTGGGGYSLGQVRIRLTCGQYRRTQMLMLCTGAQHGSTWKGRSLSAENVGRAGEYIECCNYLTSEGTESNTPLVTDVESNACKMLEEGTVTGWTDVPDFIICTRGDPSDTDMGYELGRVVAGLDVLRDAIGQYEAEDIMIADTGIIIARHSSSVP